jgi:lipoprotein-releasing system ATP-binding protein
MNNPWVLQADNIDKTYGEVDQPLQVLKNASLTVAHGQTIAIVGASGSGKSTLLHLLGGLDSPDKGSIKVDGQALGPMSQAQLAQMRNAKLGFVYQFHHLLPEFTALDNVAMPLRIRRMTAADSRERAAAMLKKVGLEQRVKHVPGQLSGGERQRVALARALVTEPLCVLADEPTGNLDRKTAALMFELVRSLNHDLGTAFVLVTHDMALAEKTDKVYQMLDGQLIQGH